RVAADDLFGRETLREVVEDHRHRNTGTRDARLTEADIGPRRDSLLPAHEVTLAPTGSVRRDAASTLDVLRGEPSEELIDGDAFAARTCRVGFHQQPLTARIERKASDVRFLGAFLHVAERSNAMLFVAKREVVALNGGLTLLRQEGAVVPELRTVA